jgi:hypothetical protein
MATRFNAAKFVRRVVHGEAIGDLVDEAKARTWREEAEHLVLQLETGERLMVKGGRDGVRFTVRGEGDGRTLHMRFRDRWVRVARIYGHTHPRVTGPSDGDLEALAILKQGHSYIFEIGGDRRGTRIRPKQDPEV